ncbi:alpha-ketoglutarate decarboxylase [Cellulophaga sp. F20128]|uniref:alpha-ketoglutarate decarboxylase n=1 Tax=Cellulophaga sp. F20128 TaxID=2926413 RepID=UPI001FF62D1F|nr:alpha-ketoglutarate decarboxylase [Cellulophaga sp. F20128]MCK0155620.1 alpha-ketoglutarate decarboxylase [Cellulophaga sp. F20128]
MKRKRPTFSTLLVFSFLLISFTHATISAQSQNTSSDFWNNVRFGGGFGLGFGNNTFNAALSPNAIYQVNDQFAIGAGLNFNYSKFRDSKLIAYGASALTYYNIIPAIQLSAEFEQLRINRKFEFDGANIEDNYWNPALFLGLGYTSRNITVGVRYDVLYSEGKSIYSDAFMPFVRVYF